MNYPGMSTDAQPPAIQVTKFSPSLGGLGFVSQYEDCSQHDVLYYRYVECPNRDFLSLLATHVLYT